MESKLHLPCNARTKKGTHKIVYPRIIHEIYHDDLHDFLCEPNNKIDRTSENIGKLVKIIVNIGSGRFDMLIDTGAEISIISTEYLRTIQNSVQHQIAELPIANFVIQGVTGSKNRLSKKQVQLEIKIGETIIPMIFLVFDKINCNIILGCDNLKKLSTEINFKTNTVIFQYENKTIEAEFNTVKNNSCDIQYIRSLKFVNKTENNILEKEEEAWQEKLHSIINFTSSEQITSTQKKQLVEIYNKYRHIFKDTPGCAKNFVCKLELKAGVLFNKKSYPVPYALRAEVQQEIDQMLKDQIIEYSVSEHTSPLLVVKKPTGKLRLCLDAREINRSLVAEKTSPEGITEILQRFHGARFFSSFDASAGYWQIMLHPESRKYVSFLFQGRSYQFIRLPFGLVNSVAIFTRCMDQVLGKRVLSFASVYVDDLLISSPDWETHCARTKEVFQRLSENNITLKLSKSVFITQETKFLGYIITPRGLSMDESKIQAIQDFPDPKNLKQLQSFLGLTNYYRIFQEHYSELTAKLKHVMSKGKKWIWGENEHKIFQEIKEKFLKKVIIEHPNYNKTFYMNCDASDIALGVVLYQIDDEGRSRVIAFGSRTLTDCERRYTITEKEALATLFGCIKFRTMILGHKIVIRSDHKAISFFRNCKLGHGRLTRWILALQPYNIEWEYVPGRCNQVSDLLSRVDLQKGSFSTERERAYQILEILTEKINLERILGNVAEIQREDPKLRGLIDELADPNSGANLFHCLYDRKLFRKFEGTSRTWKLVVPSILEDAIIKEYHVRYGHFGASKVIAAIREHMHIKGIYEKTAKLIKRCDLCQRTKVSTKKNEGALEPILASGPLEKVFIDISGPFPPSYGRYPKRYIIILLDCFSKYVRLFAVCKATTKVITKLIQQKYFPEVGDIKEIVSDHGSQFRSWKWDQELQQLGVRVTKTSLYHPQSNLSERCLREVKRLLRAYCHQDHKNWANYVEKIENLINWCHHDSTGKTPYEVIFKSTPPRAIRDIIEFPEPIHEYDHNEVIREVESKLLSEALKRVNKQKRKNIKPINYGIGDLVLLKYHGKASLLAAVTKKLMLLYTGPYIITGLRGKNVYELSDINNRRTKGVYNATEIKLYCE